MIATEQVIPVISRSSGGGSAEVTTALITMVPIIMMCYNRISASVSITISVAPIVRRVLQLFGEACKFVLEEAIREGSSFS